MTKRQRHWIRFGKFWAIVLGIGITGALWSTHSPRSFGAAIGASVLLVALGSLIRLVWVVLEPWE